MSVAGVPKADMHVHLEGTMSPDMVRKIADRNGVEIKQGLFSEDGQHFQWSDDGTAAGALQGFVQAYDDAAGVMRSARDYTDITYDYLTGVAAENCIYAEIGISADHAVATGITYAEMCSAIAKGYDHAKEETGIEARFISTFVRHYGPRKVAAVAAMTADAPHYLVTGVGIAGDENAFSFKSFLPSFQRTQIKNWTAHAGEAAGPDSVRDAMKTLGVKRFGHMVRAIEDPELMEELKKGGAMPEICVSSNLVLKVYDDYAAHPLRKFFDAGLKVMLGSDDPSFFGTTIGREYDIAHKHFGFTEEDLLSLTRNGIEASFLDAGTRRGMLKNL